MSTLLVSGVARLTAVGCPSPRDLTPSLFEIGYSILDIHLAHRSSGNGGGAANQHRGGATHLMLPQWVGAWRLPRFRFHSSDRGPVPVTFHQPTSTIADLQSSILPEAVPKMSLSFRPQGEIFLLIQISQSLRSFEMTNAA